MGRCFVIQPFDRGFSKRYDDVYEPAIRAAGLEPYRVDRDPSVVIPLQPGIDWLLDNQNRFVIRGEPLPGRGEAAPPDSSADDIPF